MGERDDFLKFLADVKPIPRAVKIAAWSGRVAYVRALTPREQKELRAKVDQASDEDVKVMVVLLGLVDSEGNQILTDASELDNCGYDAVCEIFEKITDATTGELTKEAIRGK
jgi:hypothetical protein